MPDLKEFRREWSNDHKNLRTLLQKGKSLQESKDLFDRLHAVLHRHNMSKMDLWSYADEVFSDLEERDFRFISKKAEHSLIWILWHMARIEDITMNILIGDGDQTYLDEAWRKRLNSPIHHTGNHITPEELLSLTHSVEPNSLCKYRDAVGRKTRRIVHDLNWERLNEKVSQHGLDRVVSEGAVLAESEELLAYWKKKDLSASLDAPHSTFNGTS